MKVAHDYKVNDVSEVFLKLRVDFLKKLFVTCRQGCLLSLVIIVHLLQLLVAETNTSLNVLSILFYERVSSI